MLVAILIVLNIPIYLLIGWIVFDTRAAAAESFWESIVAILKAIFVPRIVRVFMDEDDSDEAGSIFHVAVFLIACSAVTFAEHWLLVNYVFTAQ